MQAFYKFWFAFDSWRNMDQKILDEEGELFYAGEDQVDILEVSEQEYRDIFGESDVDESDFNGF